MFDNIYLNKKVLITGHTGFKGSWLTTWLLDLGSSVIGVSKDIPTKPSNFEELELEKKIKHHQLDIRDYNKISQIISQEKPDFIFHLAAQAIVSTSYNEPVETVSTNVMGTCNILDALKNSNHKCSAIIITSDKAYDNIEQIWGYRESDSMGGKDIYSGSKGAAELIIKSYFHSFFKQKKSNVRISVARAGNVIGGGDWAKDRIVVDAMSAWSKGSKVEIRNPKSTRPWQHVLEPISGYLRLGQKLNSDIKLNGEAFNFGPKSDQNYSVKKLIHDLSKYWNFDTSDDAYIITDNIPFHEAQLLKLNCDKASVSIDWEPNLDYSDTIKFTSEWYYNFYNNEVDLFNQTTCQIKDYVRNAKHKKLSWTK